MGNSLKRPSSSSATKTSCLATSLQILGDRDATPATKRAAFDQVQLEIAPLTNGTPAFSEELRRVWALRFPTWEAPPEGAVRNPEALASVVRGLLFGAAIGDAAGLATEFLSRSQIAEFYPDPSVVFKPGIEVHPDTHRMCFPRGDWTDDTDQLLLILQTLLQNGGKFDGPCFAAHLQRWKDEGFQGLGDQGGAGLGQSTKKVMLHPSFAADPIRAAEAVWVDGGRKMAANGAVMRTAVTGLPFFWDEGVVEGNTLSFCRATHADPRCAASCVAVAECVRRLVLKAATSGGKGAREEGPTISAIIEAALSKAEALLVAGGSGEAGSEGGGGAAAVAELRAHATAGSLEGLALDEGRAIGYTFKCMGAGIWALRQAEAALAAAAAPTGAAAAEAARQEPSDAAAPLTVGAGDEGPKKGGAALERQRLQEAVAGILHAVAAAGGDADTNGAVAGALVGAAVGFEGLPRGWVTALPYAPWMEAWAQKLLFMLRAPTVQPAVA